MDGKTLEGKIKFDNVFHRQCFVLAIWYWLKTGYSAVMVKNCL